MYYRHAVSQKVFSYISSTVWEKLWRWSKRRHPDKSSKWIMKKYFTTEGKRKWVFKAETDMKLLNIAGIPIVRHVKIRSGMRVLAPDEQTREYWKQREYRNALGQIYSSRLKRLYKRQQGKCLFCGRPITQREISESKAQIHHMIPRAEGGTERLNNLRLLHVDCHNKVHSVFFVTIVI